MSQKNEDVTNNDANEILQDLQKQYNKFIEENYDTSQSPRNTLQKSDLTEQFFQKKLDLNYYYIETPIYYDIDFYSISKKSFLNHNEGQITKVLAPVPSYDEWTAAQEQLHKEGIWYTEISHKKVLKENEKLKHTLQKARIHVAIDAEDYEDRTPSKSEKAEAKKLLTEIDEVLK